MKKQLPLLCVLGFSALQTVLACGDADRGGGPRGEAGDGGASEGGASAGGTAGGTAGIGNVSGEGGGSTSGGAGSSGAPSNDGGTPMGGEGAGASGGVSAGEGGSLAAGSGGVPGNGEGASHAGGQAHGGTGGGGDGPVLEGGTGGALPEPSATAGAGGESGGGAAPVAACGDGALDPGELCCTPAWQDQQLELMTQLLGMGLVGLESCIPPDGQLGVSICSSAACAGGATGCKTEVTAATVEYTPEKQRLTGIVDLVIRGRVSLDRLGCDFTANVDDLTYEADVVTRTSAELFRIRLGTPDIAYRVHVQGCGGLATVIELLLNNPIAQQAIEAPIRNELEDRLQLDLACPY